MLEKHESSSKSTDSIGSGIQVPHFQVPDGHGTMGFSHFQVPDGHGTMGFSHFQMPDGHGTMGFSHFQVP